MKPDLSLIDSLRRLIDFAGLTGNQASQAVLASLMKDLANAVEHEKFLLPANLAEAPSAEPEINHQSRPSAADQHKPNPGATTY